MNYCKCGCGAVISDRATWKPGHWARSKEAQKTLAENGARTGGWNKGIPRSEEEKKAISEGITLDGRKRISEAKKEAHKKGKEGPYGFMFGETNPSCDPEVKAKKAAHPYIHTEARKRAWKEKGEKYTGRIGTEMSDENRKKLSERMKKNNPMKNPDVVARHPIFKTGRHYVSKGENKIALIFDELKIPYKRQYPISKEVGFYILDFFLPMKKKCIEYDGFFTHFTETGIEKKQRRDSYLKDVYGIETLRILTKELKNSNKINLMKKIGDFYENSSDKDTQNNKRRRTT